MLQSPPSFIPFYVRQVLIMFLFLFWLASGIFSLIPLCFSCPFHFFLWNTVQTSTHKTETSEASQVRCLSLGRGEEDAGGVGVQVSGILTRPRYMKLFNGVIYKTDYGESSSEPDDRVIQNTYILYYNINCTQAHT